MRTLTAPVLLLLGLGVAGLATLATGSDTPAGSGAPEVCYDETVQDQIEKETRTLIAVNPHEWTAWADWPDAGPVWDDGRDRGPGPHNGIPEDQVGHRQYRYIVVDTRIIREEIPCPPPTDPPPTDPPVTDPPETTTTWPDTTTTPTDSTVPSSTSTIPATTVAPTTTVPGSTSTPSPTTSLPPTTPPSSEPPATTTPRTTTTISTTTTSTTSVPPPPRTLPPAR